VKETKKIQIIGVLQNFPKIQNLNSLKPANRVESRE
jgi:hypothetical protein